MTWFGLSLPIIQQVPTRTAPWESEAGGPEIVRIARGAEQLGYRYVTCSDHVVVAASYAPTMGATWYEPAATLGFIAGATERIELLTHVVVLAYRHPLITAKTYATLDRLSGGRVILGVGSGHAKPEFKILGRDFERRGRVTDEAIAAIRAVWREPVASFEGETVRFREAMVAPMPARKDGPPIWVGGNSAAALRRAARLGDAWIPWQLSREEFAAAVEKGKRLCAEAGRDDACEWIAPLRVGAEAEKEALAREIEGFRHAGATGFHIGIEGQSLQAYLERLEWFASQVIRGMSA